MKAWRELDKKRGSVENSMYAQYRQSEATKTARNGRVLNHPIYVSKVRVVEVVLEAGFLEEKELGCRLQN